MSKDPMKGFDDPADEVRRGWDDPERSRTAIPKTDDMNDGTFPPEMYEPHKGTPPYKE